jgi:hypothetical protein
LKNRIGSAQATQSIARVEETPDSLGFTATSWIVFQGAANGPSLSVGHPNSSSQRKKVKCSRTPATATKPWATQGISQKQRAPTAGKYTPADNLEPCYDYGLNLQPGPKKTILLVRIADFQSPKVLIGAMDFWN